MLKSRQWKKHLATMLGAGFLIMNTVAVMAAPVELTVDDSVKLALQNNPTVKMADADREKAVWAVSEAQGGNKPALSLTHSDGRAKSYSSSGKPAIANSFGTKISLSMPLYTGNKVESGIEQAKLGLKVSDLSVEKSKEQIKLDATTSYFNVLQAINVMKVSQESVDMMMAHLKNVQAQYSVGVVAKSDVLRSEVELANNQQKMISAQNGYDIAVSKLNYVMGLPLDTQVKLTGELKRLSYKFSLDESIKYSMGHRPEVIQADYAVDIAKQSVVSAKSGKLPTVVASAGTGWSDSTFPGSDNNTWTVGISATWNAFDSGVTNSRIKQSDAAVTKAREQAKQTRDAVQLEVRQAYLNMMEADKRIATTQVAVEKAEEDFKISGVRYSAGVGTNIDVIDAQVALTQAKTNYIQALYDYNTSQANLEKAMGIEVK